MNGYCIEYYFGDNMENKNISKIEERDMQKIKTDVEARALCTYYNKKITVSSRKC